MSGARIARDRTAWVLPVIRTAGVLDVEIAGTCGVVWVWRGRSREANKRSAITVARRRRENSSQRILRAGESGATLALACSGVVQRFEIPPFTRTYFTERQYT